MPTSPQPSYSRTHSSYSTASTPRAYTPSGLQYDSSNDTAYNGSEGRIDDSYRDCYDESPLAAPSRALTPVRPALGARLLSSWSNAQPAASALTRKGSVLHSRAKSLAGFVPKLNNTNTNTAPERVQAPNRIFGDLFNGESAPIRLGPPVSPTKEKEESEFVMEYKPVLTERPSSTFRRRGTVESTATTPPVQQKTSWFTRRPTYVSTPSKQQPQDELATLNLNASLFPNGPADPLNPHAFNDLLLNATNLLQRMQTAYKEKVNYIASIQPEIDAQREEVEEAETRSQALKSQLQDLSRRAQEQERTMQEMGQQLAESKIQTQEAREAAKTIRLVRTSSRDDDDDTPRRRKRVSGGSTSDSGFESDLDSVFSANSSADTPISPPSYERSWLPQGQQRKLSVSTRSSGLNNTGGKNAAAAAWATVEDLRDENRELRVQMEDMQKRLQGCIDFVGCLDGL